jgi:hypothetical protein
MAAQYLSILRQREKGGGGRVGNQWKGDMEKRKGRK